ncbi:MAG: hypothetical protein UX62_C0032G0001 [Microgenomates group bacterium GW2011_GWA2_46_7]|nr:MAG: hypothetical protein UX62_C0032G0001 [Microgenomates group bacterium GW2011_GWA2_46_7]KKU46770.1 MAG: hypothetical protein UX64_C0002G0026 [Microgenomates group bacterium GW2011_GWC2_46_7]
MATSKYLTLDKAIALGEYSLKHLEKFQEFKSLSRHGQFQLIHEALRNKEKQLYLQWAEINNQLDFSEKPYLQIGLDNIQKQIDELHKDEERLLLEYSK